MISKNTVIAFLMFSAVVLACVLVLVNVMPPSAAHAVTATRAGSFVAVTARSTTSTDLLWVANVDVQRLVVFGPSRTGAVSVMARADLRSVFERARRPAAENQ
jgi:hypothetical protein